MNWERVEGKWEQLKGYVREKWGDLTDDDIERIGGKKDKFVGRLRERYGLTLDEAEEEIDRFYAEHFDDKADISDRPGRDL